MPYHSPRKRRARRSAPSSASLTPLDHDFSPLSTSSRAQSLSPQKRSSKQPLQVKMSLTEVQMDRLTDAFSSKLYSTSLRSHGSVGEPHSKPSTQRSSPSKHLNKYSLGSIDDLESLEMNPAPHLRSQASTINLAERRNKETPVRIKVDSSRVLPRTTPQRVQLHNVSDAVSPLSPRVMYEAGKSLYTGYSGYTSDYHSSQRPEPLVTQVGKDRNAHSMADNLGNSFQSEDPFLATQNPSEGFNQPGTSENADEGPRVKIAAGSHSKVSHHQALQTPAFSPLPFYFRGTDPPAEKWGQKTMIGEGGWLERTDQSPEKAKKTNPKGMGLLDGIKKFTKNVSELHSNGWRSQQALRDMPNATRLPISLNAREQSLLYGELEYHLTNSINIYITKQLEKGRLMTDKLNKITDTWVQQGRPRVIGFRFDLETQLELLSAHIAEFVFSGRRQGNAVEIAGLLHAMKVNARAMRIRTFCHPDTVISKQLVDTQSLFNLLGVSKAEDHALSEIAHFYKICLEREAESRKKESRRARKSRVDRESFEEYQLRGQDTTARR